METDIYKKKYKKSRYEIVQSLTQIVKKAQNIHT